MCGKLFCISCDRIEVRKCSNARATTKAEVEIGGLSAGAAAAGSLLLSNNEDDDTHDTTTTSTSSPSCSSARLEPESSIDATINCCPSNIAKLQGLTTTRAHSPSPSVQVTSRTLTPANSGHFVQRAKCVTCILIEMTIHELSALLFVEPWRSQDYVGEEPEKKAWELEKTRYGTGMKDEVVLFKGAWAEDKVEAVEDGANGRDSDVSAGCVCKGDKGWGSQPRRESGAWSQTTTAISSALFHAIADADLGAARDEKGTHRLTFNRELEEVQSEDEGLTEGSSASNTECCSSADGEEREQVGVKADEPKAAAAAAAAANNAEEAKEDNKAGTREKKEEEGADEDDDQDENEELFCDGLTKAERRRFRQEMLDSFATSAGKGFVEL